MDRGDPGLLAAATVQAADIHDVRLWRAPDHTRVVFDLTGPAEHKLFMLSNPDRIVLDVEDARLKSSLSSLPLAETPIRQVRSAAREGNDLRIVLDVSSGVDPRSFSLKSNEKAGDRLVLDLYDQQAKSTQPAVKKTVTQNNKRDIVIAIDAGHGGEDPGALGPRKQREKDVVMAIAREVYALFKADSGFAPTLIRTGDYYISLKGRRDLARKRQADLFVSIHADAFKRKEANGASVYALSTSGATSTAARYLAQRENAADLVGGVRLSDKDDMLAGVLADLSMTSTLDASLTGGCRGAAQCGQRDPAAQAQRGAGRFCGAQVARYSLHPGGDRFYLQPLGSPKAWYQQLPEEDGPGDSRRYQELVPGAPALGHPGRVAESTRAARVHHRPR